MNESTSTGAAQRPIQLKFDGGAVVITPEDESRFVKEAPWAVAACQNALAVERFFEQFKNQLLSEVHAWCEKHKAHVRSAFVAFHDARIAVFIVTRSEGYDFALSDDLTNLELSLFEQKWPSEVLQIPDGSGESLQTFFNPERSLQVYGDPC